MKKTLADGSGIPINEPQGDISVLSAGDPRKNTIKLMEVDITDLEEPIKLTKELESRLVGVKDVAKAENLLFTDRKSGEVVLFVKASSAEQAGAITPQEFYERMKDLADGRDREAVHGSMDDLMCEALRSLGYSDGIDVFEDTPKWYA